MLLDHLWEKMIWPRKCIDPNISILKLKLLIGLGKFPSVKKKQKSKFSPKLKAKHKMISLTY